MIQVFLPSTRPMYRSWGCGYGILCGGGYGSSHENADVFEPTGGGGVGAGAGALDGSGHGDGYADTDWFAIFKAEP